VRIVGNLAGEYAYLGCCAPWTGGYRRGEGGKVARFVKSLFELSNILKGRKG